MRKSTFDDELDELENLPSEGPVHLLPVPDPWAHRAEGMRCRSCMWWALKSITVEKVEGSEGRRKTVLGRCRRHAPTLGGFPAVFADDWCGDHKLDETKL